MDEGERRVNGLEPMWCDACDQDKTSNSVQACSDLAHVVPVLVRRVTVVHIVYIGLDEVVVVFHFCVAILFVNCCIRRYSLYTPRR